MKYFPIKITIACLFAAPLLYIFTLIGSENYINQKYYNLIENIYIGETKPLLDGAVHLEEHIAKNIQSFLNQDSFINMFKIEMEITATLQNGKIIYPVFIDAGSIQNNMKSRLDKDEVAKNNFDLLNSGINIKVQASLSHGSRLANLIFLFYFLSSLAVFLFYYKAGSAKAALDQQQKTQLISDLKTKEKDQRKDIDKLKSEYQDLFDNIKSLKDKYKEEQDKAKTNEEGLFDEIISLEDKLNKYIELAQDKDDAIENLQTKIEKYEKRKGSKKKQSEYDFLNKRFASLYKNLIMKKKALNGLLSLNEDQQIKAEELISQLDRNPDQVTIKRKVFVGKKHKAASFEVLFAYNGRLYFNKTENNTIQILVIGTKNTQTKDMEYLHNL